MASWRPRPDSSRQCQRGVPDYYFGVGKGRLPYPTAGPQGAPLGYLRQRSDPANARSRQVLIEMPDQLALVRRCFELAAQGLTDRQVASQVDLRLTHLREILTNPFYLGQLRDGWPA